MKGINLFSRVIVFVLVLALLAGCSPKQAPIAQVSYFLTDTGKQAYLEMSQNYTQHVNLYTEMTRVGQGIITRIDNAKTEVKDELAIAEQCYVNTTEFFDVAMTDAFGAQGLTADQESASYFNMLALKQTFPGDISRCQDAITNIVLFSRSERSAIVNLKGEFFRIQAELVKLEEGTFNTAALTEFYNKHGEELQTIIKSGDKKFSDFVGTLETKPLPATFIGFPNDTLAATTKTMAYCQGYAQIRDGFLPPAQGRYPYQYIVSVDPVSGVCTLKAAAAESYYTAIMLPSAPNQLEIESGCTSFVDCPDTKKEGE